MANLRSGSNRFLAPPIGEATSPAAYFPFGNSRHRAHMPETFQTTMTDAHQPQPQTTRFVMIITDRVPNYTALNYKNGAAVSPYLGEPWENACASAKVKGSQDEGGYPQVEGDHDTSNAICEALIESGRVAFVALKAERLGYSIVTVFPKHLEPVVRRKAPRITDSADCAKALQEALIDDGTAWFERMQAKGARRRPCPDSVLARAC